MITYLTAQPIKTVRNIKQKLENRGKRIQLSLLKLTMVVLINGIGVIYFLKSNHFQQEGILDNQKQ